MIKLRFKCFLFDEIFFYSISISLMSSSVDTSSKSVMVKDKETAGVTAYNTHPIECGTAIQSPGRVGGIVRYMVHEMYWFS